jgi:ergothioneine biosynthesis protein EgtB
MKTLYLVAQPLTHRIVRAYPILRFPSILSGEFPVQTPHQQNLLSADLMDAQALKAHFLDVRKATETLAAPLSAEDAQIQSMPDASPAKWHLAHSTWLFETFILKAYDPDHPVFDEDFHYLFNSYYEAEGPRHPRPQRGLLSRPSLQTVMDYRRATDHRMADFLDQMSAHPQWPRIAALITLGCHHEQQHQELLLTDIKHALSCNPTAPAYAHSFPKMITKAPEARWIKMAGGLKKIGHDGTGFAFDNEGPQHQVWLHDHALHNRLVTTADYLQFIEDGGYRTPTLWLSEGWDWVNHEHASAPLYWTQSKDGDWSIFTLYGRQPINWAEPVCHLNFYEADAFATWAGARLPREDELECATLLAMQDDDEAKRKAAIIASHRLHPAPAQLPHNRRSDADDNPSFLQLAGEVWSWTSSSYGPYPGFRPSPGAIGEYNGKFMCNQYVLKGASCLTPAKHWRPSYRNFFPAHAQWQFTGLRLAKDI